MPPGCCGSKEQGSPVNTRPTNMSLNEESSDSIQLTYTVYGASSSDCTFSWVPAIDGSGFTGKMNARDGDTMYTHTFPTAVPRDIVEHLGQPSDKTKRGDRVIFRFKRRQPNISLQNYARK